MRIGRALAAVALVAAVCLGWTGCSAAPAPAPTSSASPPTSSRSPLLPPGATTLRDLGFTNAPEGFALPPGVEVETISNQLNVITAGFSPEDGRTVLAFLTTHLLEMGYRIQAASDDSVVFTGTVWHGAFTMSPTIALLTLRYADQ